MIYVDDVLTMAAVLHLQEALQAELQQKAADRQRDWAKIRHLETTVLVQQTELKVSTRNSEKFDS
jgi:hypothetical protein